LGEDPIGFSSGDFNFYRYTWNSPTNFIDPYGYNAGTVAGAEIGFGLGGPIGAGIGAAIGTAAIWWGVPALWDWWNSPDDNVCYANPVDKNKEPDHPDFVPHKKKKGLRKIPWNKNRKGYPDKNGNYWEPVPDGHRGTHDPHWDQQHPDGSHTPKYP